MIALWAIQGPKLKSNPSIKRIEARMKIFFSWMKRTKNTSNKNGMVMKVLRRNRVERPNTAPQMKNDFDCVFVLFFIATMAAKTIKAVHNCM